MINEDYDTMHQKQAEESMSKENDEQVAASVLASSANFGREHGNGKDMKSAMNSTEKKKPS